MSFSSEVKEELVKQMPGARHCQIAELTSLLLMCGGSVQPYLHVRTENLRVARKTGILIFRIFGITSQVRLRLFMGGRTAVIYELFVMDKKETARILQACKLTEEKRLDRLVIQKDCCKRAFLRGAFLSSGSVNSPEKSYHFEIACEDIQLAEDIRSLMRFFDLDGKVVIRKKYYVVYLKEGSMIVDALNVMEAHRALMNMENIRILKDVRNQTNRKVNCDLANINKTLTAAQRQLEDIRYIEQHKGFGSLNPGLRQVAELRIQEPDISLKELGELLDPPVSKSGVNHRLRRLSEIADSMRTGESS